MDDWIGKKCRQRKLLSGVQAQKLKRSQVCQLSHVRFQQNEHTTSVSVRFIRWNTNELVLLFEKSVIDIG